MLLVQLPPGESQRRKAVMAERKARYQEFGNQGSQNSQDSEGQRRGDNDESEQQENVRSHEGQEL